MVHLLSAVFSLKIMHHYGALTHPFWPFRNVLCYVIIITVKTITKRKILRRVIEIPPETRQPIR